MSQFWIYIPTHLKIVSHTLTFVFPFSLFTAHCAFLNFVTHCDQISRNCNPRYIFASLLSDKCLCDGISSRNSSPEFSDVSTISLIQLFGSPRLLDGLMSGFYSR